MFTRKLLQRRRAAFLLTLALIFSLSGCSALPHRLEQLSDRLTHVARQLDEVSAFLSTHLEVLLDRLYRQEDSLPPPPEGSTFAVHFLDVGQADCALVACDGAYMLIDGGNNDDSSLIFSYLKEQGVERLDYLVATHPHEDHIGGLAGAAYAAQVGVALSSAEHSNSEYFSDLKRALDLRGVTLTVPEPGYTFSLGSARVEVLGPLKEYEDLNDTSLVLRVCYGDTAFLFTGDMETAAETDLVESGAVLDADVLKVGHHGSSSSTSYRFLRQVMPDYAVISVGEDNRYGHPTETVLSRLEDADVQLYRTDRHGTVIAHSDGKTVTFRTEQGLPPDTGPSGEAVPLYSGFVGNRNSKKLHTPDCPSVADISEDNTVFFDSRQAADDAGYAPCGRCQP